MPIDDGFEALTGHHLGQDWHVFGSTADEILRGFVRGSPADVADAIKGLEKLRDSGMDDDEAEQHWVFECDGGYDPHTEGRTFHEFFAHAVELLRAEAARKAR